MSKHLAIAKLFAQMRMFDPVLNEKQEWTGAYQPRTLVNQKQKIPERDDLLTMIGEASADLIEWISEIEQIKTTANAQTATIFQISSTLNQLLGNNDHTGNPLEKLDIIAGRYEQMKALLANLLTLQADAIKPTIRKFLEFKGIHLVNQNETKYTEIPVCTCKGILPAFNEDPNCPIHGMGSSTQPPKTDS